MKSHSRAILAGVICVQANWKTPIRGEVYLAAEKVMDAIDDAALVLTGRRDHFWLIGH